MSHSRLVLFIVLSISLSFIFSSVSFSRGHHKRGKRLNDSNEYTNEAHSTKKPAAALEEKGPEILLFYVPLELNDSFLKSVKDLDIEWVVLPRLPDEELDSVLIEGPAESLKLLQEVYPQLSFESQQRGEIELCRKPRN